MTITFEMRKRRDKEAAEITELLKKQNRSESWLAEAIGESRQSVNKWLKGETVPINDAIWVKMRQVLVIGNTFGEPLNIADTIALPVLRVGSAGDGNTGSEVAEEVLDVPVQLAYPDYRCVRIEGFSMVPNLLPGDIAIFREWPAPKNKTVCAVEAFGELLIKEVDIPGAALHSFNPEFPDIPIPTDARILGYLVGFFRDDGHESAFRHNRTGLRF